MHTEQARMTVEPPSVHQTEQHLAKTQNEPQQRSRMSIDDVTPSRQSAQDGEPEPLRGGCIPCPDGGCCWIIPLPCL
ncbi:uncharacterized protein L969DRAFT_42525 [Mixia osmundae IAM 14324]|uniref:Uncharacterized protein n=1 Tax=Mixia osmundae (strain CBS 9802 / IAM 14324 / JCM 22182 / KY 12970) TaxID=764103 RepID=G7E3U7_MIXOS|nr:uncharacterized protein L969DRAFT_42525 [Mixia osmundae IAM 14324]KEI41952.1 hypothetical protein L969DRAFT_42525 [Mixia osmundae IAM 14324]GAA97507.1 hypothetical protein E5Q_04185 [Mixia osmundae IAM 14324]